MRNLSPVFDKNSPAEIFQGKMETFLACRKLAEHMTETVLDEAAGKLFEEMALKAIYKTFFTNVDFADMKLIIAELPSILARDYPVTDEIRKACIKIIPQIMNTFRVYDINAWKEFVNLKYLLKMLNSFNQ